LADAMMESPGIPTRDTGNYFMFLFLGEEAWNFFV
jgi:hypothetical protein